MSAEDNNIDRSHDGDPRPERQTTEDERFHLDLMENLGREFPNAFVRQELKNGDPFWSVRNVDGFDPIGLRVTTDWVLTKHGITGTNDLVNGRSYNPQDYLDDFQAAKSERHEGLDGSQCISQVGDHESRDYGRFLIFETRHADPDTLEEFGRYLKFADFAGRNVVDKEVLERKKLPLESVLGGIKAGADS
jgi:hypothetical protein